VLPAALTAHNPLSARYHLDTKQQPGVLTINLSQDGVNLALLQTHSRAALEEMSQREFEELIVAYVKRNFEVAVNGEDIRLGEGGIRLGSHQTDLKFVLTDVAADAETISADIPAFSENEAHQTIFSYRVGGKSEHVILSSDNEFRAAIGFNSTADSFAWYWLVLLALAGLLLLLLFMPRSRATTPVISVQG